VGVEWAQLVVPVAASVVIGFVSGLLSHVFATARSLRADLALDLDILDRLKDDARPKKMLSHEVTRRMYLLVAYTRFPPLLRLDFYLLVGLVGSSGLAMTVAVGVGDATTEAAFWFLGVLSLAAAGCWYRSFSGWATRAVKRLSFIVENATSPDDIKDLLAGLKLARFFATIGGAFLVGVPPNWAVIRLFDDEHWAVIGKPTLDPLHSGLRSGSYGEQGQVWPEEYGSRRDRTFSHACSRRRAERAVKMSLRSMVPIDP